MSADTRSDRTYTVRPDPTYTVSCPACGFYALCWTTRAPRLDRCPTCEGPAEYRKFTRDAASVVAA